MKLRHAKGHSLIEVSTGPNVLYANQWAQLKYQWIPSERNLSIYVDGTLQVGGDCIPYRTKFRRI